MRPSIPILIGLALWGIAVDARRVRVRPVGGGDLEQNPQQVEYYAEQPEDDNGPVLVSRQDTYGRANGQARLSPRLRPETARQPPVQTIKNYNKLNDDGSFTFGYEAADGSFKEETRGTDCVVRGKYGYVDPDGNKREFSYVSGNPCDPNAVNQEEEEVPALDSGEENIPQNIPRRPLKQRPTTRPNRPTTTVYQQSYNSAEEDGEEEENIPSLPIRPIQHKPVYTAKPVYTPKPAVVYRHPSFSSNDDVYQSQVFRSSTPRPKAAYVPQPTSSKPAIRITPRPALSSTIEPATTYRPQLLQVSPSPTATAYTKQIRPVSSTTPSSYLDFNEELKKFQLENNVISSTEKPTKGGVTSEPIYSSELVYDPASGQYNTVLYQQLSQANGAELNLKQRLQPYVDNPFAGRPYVPQTRPLHYQQQALFQQQQASLLQQSQQLFAQQQQQKKQQQRAPVSSSVRYESPRAVSPSYSSTLFQQEPQQFQPISPPQRYSVPKAATTPQRYSVPEAATTPQRYQFPQAAQSPIAQYYYVAPQGAGSGTNLASGQIDAFLRGQSLTI